MVSFWPFRGGDTSAAGFEKILSNLSQKINKLSAKDARLRSQQRRLRVLWTLYTGFAYLVAILILVLVLGWRQWDVAEYTGLAVSPVAIYGVRLAIDNVYNYRISGTQIQLEVLQKQRSEAIEKLKAATKYNSTQQLLEKYGGSGSGSTAGGSKQSKPTADKRRKSNQHSSPQAAVQRTGIAPPPTANIPHRSGPESTPHVPTIKPAPSSQDADVHAEFAPNAFEEELALIPDTSATMQVRADHQRVQLQTAPPRWYDRVLDAILGEDETQPRNRIALICQSCRLVNGQAPPGTRTLEDLGRWRCMACGTENGVQSVAEKAVSDAMESVNQDATTLEVEHKEHQTNKGEESPSAEGEGEMQSIDESGSDAPTKSTGRATRPQARQRKN